MKKRIPIVLSILIIADIYVFQAIKTLTASPYLLWGYWLFDLLIITGMLFVLTQRRPNQSFPRLISWLMGLMLLSLIPKVVAMPVLLLEDITRLFRGFPPRSFVVSEIALISAAMPFFSLLYGITRGRHYYKVHKETLYFDDLPEAFDGFTITQLSDIHSGSFTSAKGVQK